MNDHFKTARAFIVMELLIVMAMSATNTRDPRTTCLNNLRQISLGVRLYADEARDAAPSPGSAGGVTNVPIYRDDKTADHGPSRFYACFCDPPVGYEYQWSPQ